VSRRSRRTADSRARKLLPRGRKDAQGMDHRATFAGMFPETYDADKMQPWVTLQDFRFRSEARSGLRMVRQMSALGQKQTLRRIFAMSALPPKADIGTHPCDVRFVPIADMATIRSTGQRELEVPAES